MAQADIKKRGKGKDTAPAVTSTHSLPATGSALLYAMAATEESLNRSETMTSSPWPPSPPPASAVTSSASYPASAAAVSTKWHTSPMIRPPWLGS